MHRRNRKRLTINEARTRRQLSQRHLLASNEHQMKLSGPGAIRGRFLVKQLGDLYRVQRGTFEELVA